MPGDGGGGRLQRKGTQPSSNRSVGAETAARHTGASRLLSSKVEVHRDLTLGANKTYGPKATLLGVKGVLRETGGRGLKSAETGALQGNPSDREPWGGSKDSRRMGVSGDL